VQKTERAAVVLIGARLHFVAEHTAAGAPSSERMPLVSASNSRTASIGGCDSLMKPQVAQHRGAVNHNFLGFGQTTVMCES